MRRAADSFGPGVRRPWLAALPLSAAALLATAANASVRAQSQPTQQTPPARPLPPTAAGPGAAAPQPVRPSARECFDKAQADYFAGRDPVLQAILDTPVAPG